jgi:DNA-directed RNA polymerase specialized sigma subunit
MKITNSEDDLILVQKIKEDGCSESMEKLIDRHQDLYYSCVHRYHKNHQNSNLSDMLDDIYTVFNYAVKSFKTGKGAKFSTWLAHMSRFHCLNSNKKINNVMSVENNEIDKIHQTQNKYFTFKDNMVEIMSIFFIYLTP